MFNIEIAIIFEFVISTICCEIVSIIQILPDASSLSNLYLLHIYQLLSIVVVIIQTIEKEKCSKNNLKNMHFYDLFYYNNLKPNLDIKLHVY